MWSQQKKKSQKITRIKQSLRWKMMTMRKNTQWKAAQRKPHRSLLPSKRRTFSSKCASRKLKKKKTHLISKAPWTPRSLELSAELNSTQSLRKTSAMICPVRASAQSQSHKSPALSIAAQRRHRFRLVRRKTTMMIMRMTMRRMISMRTMMALTRSLLHNPKLQNLLPSPNQHSQISRPRKFFLARLQVWKLMKNRGDRA